MAEPDPPETEHLGLKRGEEGVGRGGVREEVGKREKIKKNRGNKEI